MASPAVTPDTPTRTAINTDTSFNDAESDYGSDFSPEETQLVEALLSQQHAPDDNPIVNDIEDEPRQALRLPRVVAREQMSALFQAARAAEEVAEQISQSVKTREYPDLSTQLREPTPAPGISTDALPPGPQLPDTRSPLERFRTPPKKALSVTDLVSPAWCELQYWYTLTLHGRKRRTPEMKQGSVVHQKLEDQVHTTVKVDVQTKEDAWGLRIWNVIQGLKTLRETGLTRELEIWGTVDGLVVNGIIDEISYICPDVDLEKSLEKPTPQDQLSSDQTTIADYFKAGRGTSIKEATGSKKRAETNKVYLCDVKTRSVKSLPSNTAFRPTRMQLQLYHQLLSALATNTVDFSVLAERYKLDPSKTFSDSFIIQVGSLNDEVYESSSMPEGSQDSPPVSSQDSMSTLLAHSNLSALWSLMITEFQVTFPNGASSFGRILKTEYRSRNTGEVVGSKTFAMNEQELKEYIDSEMQWWKGEREARGVVVEEAYKCRSCDFSEQCEWRLKKVEEAKEKVRMTKKRTAAV